MALDGPRSGGNVATDAIHFEGSPVPKGELTKQSFAPNIAEFEGTLTFWPVSV